MCTSFSCNDIKDALWSIPDQKSPGPDSYSSGNTSRTHVLLRSGFGRTIRHTKRDLWQLGDPPKVSWAKLLSARSLIPRHAFITWIYTHRAQPTSSLYMPIGPGGAATAERMVEFPNQSSRPLIDSLITVRGLKAQTHISYAIFIAGIHYIWRARNMVIFQNKRIPSHQMIQIIREQVKNGILF
ncbi:LOW QUALITY PROTEIN: hypothetical protein Cgig2_010820 [Carnegiea gigantea]|uniref:Uncharacterized protein n=1 Tax=Carnegiea gigantea TaxID=171969 RepID=A0A9Q1GGA0_9CARY|nr:LOW QUALITY PROTEIN: hypothetical protein Cgig2_010820 [Carnegiea gigantea]